MRRDSTDADIAKQLRLSRSKIRVTVRVPSQKTQRLFAMFGRIGNRANSEQFGNHKPKSPCINYELRCSLYRCTSKNFFTG